MDQGRPIHKISNFEKENLCPATQENLKKNIALCPFKRTKALMLLVVDVKASEAYQNKISTRKQSIKKRGEFECCLTNKKRTLKLELKELNQM